MESQNGSNTFFFWNTQLYWFWRDVLNEMLTFRGPGHPKNRIENDKKEIKICSPKFVEKYPKLDHRGDSRGAPNWSKWGVKYEPKKGYETKSNLGLDTPSDSGVSRSGKGVRGKGKPFLVFYDLYFVNLNDWLIEFVNLNDWLIEKGCKDWKDWRVDTSGLNHLTPRGLVGL